MHDILSLPFMQRALVAGVLIGFVGSYFGVFVVQRRMSFMGDGLSHAAFGGVALGLLLGIEPLWIAVPFTIVVSILIIFLKEKTRLEVDTSIGILFSVSVALGIIFLSLKKGYTSEAFTYLFGSILAVSSEDLVLSGLLAAVCIATFFLYWSKWAYTSFDSELARSDRLPIARHDYILSILLALSIVVSVKVVGIILIAAFLVIPAATARLLASTFLSMTAISVAIGVSSSLAGLLLSFLVDLPSGATIILLQAFIFALAAIINKFKSR